MKKSGSLLIIFMLVLLLALGACSGSSSSSGSTTASTAATGTTGAATINAPSTTATSASGTTATTAATVTTAPTTTATVPTTTAAPMVFNPLTGMPLADSSRATMRPVGVMINNIEVATPQLGINAADMYYEMIAEGGITRMLVVFADPMSVVELGSIRSARSDFIDFAGGLDAVLVHAGASYAAKNQLTQQKTAHIDMSEVPEAFWRDADWRRDRGYEHSVRTTGDRLTAAIAKLGIRSTLKDASFKAFKFLPYGESKPAADPAANPAATVIVTFSDYNTSTFRYDAQTMQYSKYEFGKPQIDLADNKTVSVTNVLILRTTIKSIDNTILRDANLASGSGYYVSNGARVSIKWKKGTTTEPFILTNMDGSPLQVNRGKTYVCIQGTSESLKFS